jgi:DNA-binding MarR family transcriptional regulator
MKEKVYAHILSFVSIAFDTPFSPKIIAEAYGMNQKDVEESFKQLSAERLIERRTSFLRYTFQLTYFAKSMLFKKGK